MDRSISLGTIGHGAAEELFQDAVARVLANIDDPNTSAKAKREVTLTVIFEPMNEDRRSANVAVSVRTKLAANKPHSSTVGIGISGGKLTAIETMKQEELFPVEQARPRLSAVANEPEGNDE